MKQTTKARLPAISIPSTSTLMDAFRRMDQANVRLLIVTDQGSFRGLISSGDLQRAIIANRPMESEIAGVLRRDIRVADEGDDFGTIKEIMLRLRTEFMPVLDAGGELSDVIFWEDVFESGSPKRDQIGLPVVIMAGGKGTRLKPFSNILPKPLFPLGQKTIIEEIMDRFEGAGCKKFLLSVNHKADLIKSYFEHLEGREYDIRYFQEDEPMGTAGSLHLVADEIRERFFVTNCDIVIDTDYSEIVSYHEQHANEITLVAAIKIINIPYGTVESGEGGRLEAFREKPEITYLVNAGLYLLEPHLLGEIPKEGVFHITQLIDKVRDRGGRVGVFPVSEKSWCDIGQWEEYRRTLAILGEQD